MTPSTVSINGLSASIKYIPLKRQFSASGSSHVGYGRTVGAALAHLIKLSAKGSSHATS